VLFCISILLEVFDQIDPTASFPKMLLTALIIFPSIGCLALGLVMIFVEAVNFPPNYLITLCVIPVCLYALDAITYFLVRPPASSNNLNQEDTLKSIQISN